jgi:hypothetical protein
MITAPGPLAHDVGATMVAVELMRNATSRPIPCTWWSTATDT